MPRPLIPHQSGVHRAACLALYRALLRQKKHLLCYTVPLRGYDLRIGAVFRRNRWIQGHGKITVALNLGYTTLDALRDHTRREHALKQMTRIPLVSPKTSVKPQPALYQKDGGPGNSLLESEKEKLPTRPLLERPYLTIPGRRHVPKLVNACRFPYLRIKKPQPAQLSRMISDSIRVRERRLIRSQELQDQITTAQEEDQWDNILLRELGVSRVRGEGLWITAPQAALDAIRESHETAIRKRISMAVRMTDIIEQEAALAKEERRRRLDIKHKARKARRLQ
ncbi:MAG: hypothetical protein Q9163_004350 [Psora crenata]